MLAIDFMRLILEEYHEVCLIATPSDWLWLRIRSVPLTTIVIPSHVVVAAYYEPDRTWLAPPDAPHPPTWSGAEHNRRLPKCSEAISEYYGWTGMNNVHMVA